MSSRRVECGLVPEVLFADLRREGYQVFLHSQSGKGWSYCARGDRFRAATLAEFSKTVCARRGQSCEKSNVPFESGWIVVLSYDLGRNFEKLPDKNPVRLVIPDILMLEVEDVFAFDHLNRQWWYSGEGDGRAATSAATAASCDADSLFALGRWNEEASTEQYRAMVLAAKEFIAAGDIYQVNLARWFSAGLSGDVFGLFKQLYRKNPSPYAGFIDLKGVDGMPDSTIVSSSPELLIERVGDRVTTRPIAGTYPKSLSKEELPRDPKERAEHVMLVDLERNDIGRVAIPGSVKVQEMLTIEEYSHLYHIVSQVGGCLQPGAGVSDVLRAVFPGGTITGTPKIRAMEIIDELESYRRGIYTGSFGYITRQGDMNLNILIRTAMIQQGRIHLATGAGIVADSDPDRECQETVVKAMSFLELKVPD